jgi:cytosine/adenosine deaminase-related metal-dependent hydrolase
MSPATPILPADVVIRDVAVVTMDAADTVLPDGHVAIRDDRIVGVGAGAPDPQLLGRDTNTIYGRGGVVIPGLISTHQHAIDVLLRGWSQELDLLEWCVKVYYPGTGAYTPEDVAVAVALAMDEGLRAGVTTVVDNWSASLDPVLAMESAQAALEAYERAGNRVIFARMFSDALPPSWSPLLRALGAEPEDWLEDTDRALSDIETLMGGHPRSAGTRIEVCPSPTSAQTVTRAGLVGARDLARRFGSIVPVHHCETRLEARMFPESGPGITTTAYLGALDLLGRDLVAAHCVWLDERDIRLLAETASRVAHCPTSNMMLGSGHAPVAALRRAGVTVSLGCDNAMVNNNVSLLGEVRLATLLAKLGTLDAGALTPEQALAMATRDGAQAIGRGDELGVIEVGRKADLVLLDRSGPHWVPCHRLAAAIVFQAHVDDVRTVLVDGEVVLRDRAPTRPLDTDDLYRRAAERAAAVMQRAGIDRRG